MVELSNTKSEPLQGTPDFLIDNLGFGVGFMDTKYIFEFSRSFQFTEEEIKEYIDKNEIEDINDISVEDLIHYTLTKYKISGWGDDCLDSNSNNDENDFIKACSELLGEEEEEE
ncbi:hypothetical protein FML29_09895 [Klebsiella oxytoca]|uniref:hypothetical protein n=2 Tax=Klebsiella/Raoultella group TaxID=2890311 RepID=UPI001CCBFF36|nr:hypothetical protein [Klebsiella oxytoca]MBZ7683023.1 hypothetical protein [Klebsiella oxytoca]